MDRGWEDTARAAMDTLSCSECGEAVLDDDAMFCAHCGASLDETIKDKGGNQ